MTMLTSTFWKQPLGDDQKVTEENDGPLLVEATVNNSGQLRWWLLGFGYHVQLESSELREEFMEVSEKLINDYNDK